MFELEARLIFLPEYNSMYFSFGDNHFKYNYFRIPYEFNCPFIIISQLKEKLKSPRIKELIATEKGYGYREFDLRDFVNSLFLFLGKDDSKWKEDEKYHHKECMLKPIYLS